MYQLGVRLRPRLSPTSSNIFPCSSYERHVVLEGFWLDIMKDQRDFTYLDSSSFTLRAPKSRLVVCLSGSSGPHRRTYRLCVVLFRGLSEYMILGIKYDQVKE